MKTFYPLGLITFSVLLFSATGHAQQPTTVVPSSNCNFTYNFNTTDEGFSSPSIYSDANDFGLYWDGAQLAETVGSALPIRTASTISGVYFNTESNRTTIGFDYTAPVGTEYRIRVISGVINPPLEILATTANGPLWTPLPSTSGSLCLELQDNDLPLNVQLRYEITFRTVAPGPITFDNFRRQTFNSPLPVTFMGFIASEDVPGTIRLLWNVAEEANVDHYDVENSTDGIHFNTMGSVKASGKDNYAYLYNADFKGTMYFRVRNVDIDNRFKYTGIIRIQHGASSNDLRAYPVPATDQVVIEYYKQPQPATISIIGSDGQLMKQLQAPANSYQSYINVRAWKSGIYFVKYDDGNGRVRTATIVKQ